MITSRGAIILGYYLPNIFLNVIQKLQKSTAGISHYCAWIVFVLRVITFDNQALYRVRN
jgi:hypothetical protein